MCECIGEGLNSRMACQVSKQLFSKTPMNFMTICVISNQEMYRNGVISLFRDSNKWGIIEITTNDFCSLSSIAKSKADLIVYDIDSFIYEPNIVQRINLLQSETSKLIVITSNSPILELTEYTDAGASCILSRHVKSAEFVAAIESVVAGRKFFCKATANKLSQGLHQCLLTRRELEILQYLALGLSNKEIASRLNVQIGTIKTHLINIIGKLKVSSRTGAVIRGVQLSLIRI